LKNLPSPASRTPARLLVSKESFKSFRSFELIPDAPDEMLVVDDAVAMADVSVTVDAIEYDPYADDVIEGAYADEDTDEL
jgi:hypothetical protein